MSCPLCGYDPAQVAPRDAEVALRSFPRRFRELLDRVDGEAAGDDAAAEHRRGAVLGHAAAAASEIARAGQDLDRVLVSSDAALTGDGQPGPAAASAPDDAVDLLAAAAETVAALAARTPAGDWRREGRRHGTPVTALGLLGEAVHSGVHHLRAAPGE